VRRDETKNGDSIAVPIFSFAVTPRLTYNRRFSPREARAETAKKFSGVRRAPQNGLSSRYYRPDCLSPPLTESAPIPENAPGSPDQLKSLIRSVIPAASRFGL
jgi:hypothetical protein